MTEEQLKIAIDDLDSVLLPDYTHLFKEHLSPKEKAEREVVVEAVNHETLSLENYVLRTRFQFAERLRTVNDITEL